MINLINGDCLETMEQMYKDGVKIDLTVTSPPYDNLRTYKDSLQWNEDIWKRVIKNLYNITAVGGVVVWVVGDATVKGSETGTSFKQALYFKECGFKIHDTMIYAKNSYMPLSHKRYEQQFEYMFVFVKGKLKTFNPIMILSATFGTKRNRGKSKSKEASYSERKREELTAVKPTKQKANIWIYDVGNNDKTNHTAPFPEQLAKDHIISWSNENDIVFDPFMGSGTTGKMAKLLNRDFIGVEKVKEYFDISVKRIDIANKNYQPELF